MNGPPRPAHPERLPFDHAAALQLVARAAAAAERLSSLDEAASVILADLAEATGWSARPVSVLVEGLALVGLAERAAASGQPAWGSGESDPAGVAVPVLVGGEVAAVIELATDELVVDELIADLLVAVAQHLARVVERERAAAALRESEERYAALAETAEAERRAFQSELAQRTLHDSLTGLPNRALLQDRLQHALASGGRRGSSIAVLSLDVDRFKTVNDRFGHDVGDQLLLAVAGRLQSALRPDDTIARIAGDQFAALCEDVADAHEAQRFAARVVEAFGAPLAVAGEQLGVTVTVGVALGSADSSRADHLLRHAEAAREQARQRGRGQSAFYDAAMQSDADERLTIEQDLRVAIGEGQLRLYYQPIVDLTSGAIAGVEALVRWQHPSRGLLLPQAFIGAAEDSGLIVPLGRWVLGQACRQGAAWQQQRGRHEPLRVSVNVSALQFRQPHWSDEVAQALLSSGFEPGQLVLEITESVLMDDVETTARRLADLRGLGVRVAIDDFGTGYSSLGYLRHFPVDILKVDKSFIDGVADGPHESALARAVIKLAATLHLDAVAEGVSSRKQLASLRRLHCRYAQGFYFARPQPVEQLEGTLSRTDLGGADRAESRASVGAADAP